jgi:hypothetical protein
MWQHSLVEGLAHRSMCCVSQQSVFLSTIAGQMLCLDRTTGNPVWRRQLSTEGVWMPPSLCGDRIAIVAEGVLQILSASTGERLQEIAVGHTPYSACSVRGSQLLLGAGDPPYNGMLFGIELSSEPDPVTCTLERTTFFVDAKASFDVALTITSAAHCDRVWLDTSSIGQREDLEPTARDGNTFIFHLVPAKGRHCGTYALPVRMRIGSKEVVRTVRLKLDDDRGLPRRVFLSDVPRPSQEALNYSGAACIQAIRARHGTVIQQSSLRHMSDAVLDRSGYFAFDLWRLVARRVLLSSAREVDEMPEFAAAARGRRETDQEQTEGAGK